MKAKSFLKILVIKEICCSLPPGLDGRKVCSQEHISLITNIFLNDFAFIFQFQHKGTEILGSILYLSLLRPAICACM